MLAARAARSECVDTQIGRVQANLVGRVRLGQNRHRACAGVDAPLRFRHRYPLHPVAPGLEFELPIDAVAVDTKHEFLVATQVAGGFRHHFGAPAPLFAVAQVHASQVTSEQRRLVTAGAGANLNERIAGVIRVARQQGRLQFDLQSFNIGTRSAHFFSRQLGHVGLGQQ